MPFQGRRYGGRRLANRLICLGSPHTALKATPLRALVARVLPGACHGDSVRYISVAGAVNLDPAAGEASDTARRPPPGAHRPPPTATAPATPTTAAMAWCPSAALC